MMWVPMMGTLFRSKVYFVSSQHPSEGSEAFNLGISLMLPNDGLPLPKVH
jgi:hypothetical protein